MLGLLKRIFGTKNEREVRRLREQLVPQVNRIEAELQALPDEALRQKTTEWKARLSAVNDLAQLDRELETILPEAFAVVKNACRRLCGKTITVRGHPIEWNMVPFDVQTIGGYALHSRRIAEMATGEGKTLVATLPVYLNALTGRGVHVVTVNDYLAARDAEWMGAVYTFLGLTVGCIQNDQHPDFRRAQYQCDITYGTNSEFGFDYLRDNGMADRREEQVQRGHYYAIVDEVDSILIDEARTPLIISGPAVVNADNKLYAQLKSLVESLVRRQQRLADEMLAEAEAQLAKAPKDGGADSADENHIGMLLYKARLGQPKAARLMRLLEDPANLRRLNTAELDLHKDQSKKDLYDAKESLYFAIEEKSHEADLTEKGRGFLSPSDPDAFVLPDLVMAFHEVDTRETLDAAGRMAEKQQVQQQYEARAERIHVISQLLKAYCLYEIDQQYIIEENKVIIVDEHTGRKMPGRRWSDGLHQAVEAKEGVEVERETQTYATITIQNYFRLYHKLAGMTGTAETEATEFFDIYKLGVLVIPTNQPCVRQDGNDSVYKTKREKFKAVLSEIRDIHGKGRPILVGTASVEASESLSRLLKKESVVHAVLNAKYHQQEAEIIARAGQHGSVTIATNMAGRGTDIKLGPGVAERGGLHVLATERHEARRIDRQLRGRCARQGDPGSSHFFLSLEDDVMRLYGGDRMVKLMEKMGLEEDQELTHPILNRSIETAQKRVEEHHFQQRKRTLEYDDVMNKQREILYGFRNKIIHGEDVREHLLDIMEEIVIQKVEQFLPADMGEEGWNLRALGDWANLNFPIGVSEASLRSTADAGTENPVAGSVFDGLSPQQYALCRELCGKVQEAYRVKAQHDNPAAIASVERYTMLGAIDRLWREHLYAMDGLRNSIGLRAYGQQDPLIEYKREAKEMFDVLMANIKTEICHNIFRSASSVEAYMNFLRSLPSVAHHESASGGEAKPAQPQDEVSALNDAVSRARPLRAGPKVGRNDPCPCNSGKKFKQCCGR